MEVKINDALKPITRDTSVRDLIDRLIYQIRLVENDSVRYELETITTYIDLKIDEMETVIHTNIQQW